MISLSFDKQAAEGQIAALMDRFRELPKHIAKKHLQASMKRALSTGVPILKRHTPKQKSRLVLGRDKGSGEYTGKKVKGGALRRAVTAKAKYIGRNADGIVYGVVGYKYGTESRKALWLDGGTVRMAPRKFMDSFLAEYSGPCSERLAVEMAAALEKAAAELAAGMNPIRKY